MSRSPVRMLALVALCGGLAGCAALGSVQHTVGGWFGAKEEPPAARYSAKAGVALHESPDPSSPVVGRLGLHEGVLRYQRDDGWSFVRSEASGHAGWVLDVQLIERLPAAKKAAAAATSAAPAQAVTPDDAAAPEVPPEATETPEPGEPTGEEPARSVFDPY